MFKFAIKDGKQFNPEKSPFALYMHLLTETLPGYPMFVQVGKIMEGTGRKEKQVEEEIEALRVLVMEGKVSFDNDSFYIFRNMLFFQTNDQFIPPALTAQHLCLKCKYDIVDAENERTKEKIGEEEIVIEW